MLMNKGIKNFFRKIEICAKIVAFFVENRAIFEEYLVSREAYRVDFWDWF